MMTAGLSEMEGFSAGCCCGVPAGFCAGAAGAFCACNATAKHKAPKAMKARKRETALDALIRNDLKNNCIVQLRVLLRQRSWYIDFQAMRKGRSNPRLGLDYLWRRGQRYAIQMKSKR